MFNEHDYESVLDATVYDRNGDKVGSVGNLFLDDKTGQPSWLSVNTGLFGLSESFVPIDANLSVVDGRIDVPYEKSHITDAPRMDADEHLDADQERELYAHYEREYVDDTEYFGEDHDRETVTHHGADDLSRDVDVERTAAASAGTGVGAYDNDTELTGDRPVIAERETDEVSDDVVIDRDRQHVDGTFDPDGDAERRAEYERENVAQADADLGVDRDTGLSLDRDREADLDRGDDHRLLDDDGNIIAQGGRSRMRRYERPSS